MAIIGGTEQQQAAADSAQAAATVITLDKALEIALSESPSVKVADKEIETKKFAKKGSYAALFPEIYANGTFNRTLKKQVMSMDFGGISQSFEVGRWNTWGAGLNAQMPLINAQLWKSLKISGEDVEIAVEKARSSRLETVNQVKQAYYGVLLAKEANKVYKEVYDNALANCELTEKKYNVSKASELDLARAKTAVANAVPNLYDSDNAIALALWQLKAVMGIALDENIDVADSLLCYGGGLEYTPGDLSLANNSTMRQLELQAEEVANAIRIQQYANLPTLSLAMSYSYNAMEDTFKFKEYDWFPYSYVALSLNIPIFAGGKRHSAVKQARLQAESLDIQKENTERQLKIAISQYLSTMQTASKSFATANEALELARKAYDISAKSYEVGRSTLTDLNDAQLALTQAQLGVSQAVYSFIVAKAGLESTLGADFTSNEK